MIAAMIATLILHSLDEKLSDRLTLTLLVLLMLFPILIAVSTDELAPDPMVFWLAVVLGTGGIGRDHASGSLALALTRPIKRRDYLLARWAALCLAGTLCVAIQLGLEVALLEARADAVAEFTKRENAALRHEI